MGDEDDLLGQRDTWVWTICISEFHGLPEAVWGGLGPHTAQELDGVNSGVTHFLDSPSPSAPGPAATWLLPEASFPFMTHFYGSICNSSILGGDAAFSPTTWPNGSLYAGPSCL